MTSHLIIPDTQVSPGVPTDHIEAAGNLIVEQQPDVIVHIGDHWDFPSLSQYESRSSHYFEGKRYKDDLEAGKKAMDRLLGPMKEYNKKFTRWKKKKYQPRLVFTLGNHPLTPDHELLTPSGWKYYTEVSVGDLVMTRNEKGESEWQPIEDMVTKEIDEEIYDYNSSALSLSCTETHRILYKAWEGCEKYKPAREVPKHFDIICSAIPPDGSGVNLSDEELRLAAVLSTDSHHTPAGGFVLYQSGENAKYIREILDSLSVNYKEIARDREVGSICGKELHSRKISYEFHVNRQEGRRWREHLGVFDNKRLPYWVMNLSQRQWEIYKDVLIFCDGTCYSDGRPQLMFYGQKPICEDFQSAAVIHGARASLREYRPGHWRVNYNPHCHKVRVDGFHNSKVNYKGLVWCIQTRNTNFFTRKNGNVHVTGNCYRVVKAINEDPRLEGTISLYNLPLDDWEWYDFQEMVEIDGILYSHLFINPESLTGRPVGGTVENKLKLIGQSFTMGHQPGLQFGVRYGATGRSMYGLVAGSFYTHDEDYIGPQGNRHYWRGLVMKYNVENGAYNPWFVDVDYLRRHYV